ncbi:MAG TPA: MMPL family transporter [Polyangiaceae bacterium]|nr:MMPL family transporter [Polyangiaceae bacterium]
MTELSTRPLSTYTRWLLRHRVWVLLAFTLLFGVAALRTVRTYAALRGDLEELLPKNAPSVQALAELRERVPGIRHLGVVVELDRPEQLPQAERFLDALAERIRGYPKDMVAAVRVDAAAEKAFANTYALQIMDPEDVARLREAVEERRDWDVTRQMGLDLEDESEAPRPEIPIGELRAKYEARFGAPRKGPGASDRFVAPDGRSVVLLVQAAAHETGQAGDRALLDRVKQDVRELGFPDGSGSGMRVGYAADVAMQVEELSGLQADLTVSGAVVLLLVVGSLVWFYGSFRALPILGIPLAVGTVLAFGVVALPPLSILYLNSNTAFLGSIIVGNGINSGVILLARFQEERRSGATLVAAIDAAVRSTWKATLAAALAAATAYGSLVFTDFRGFNQFGWIGGFGMVLSWAAMYALVPLLVFYWGARLGSGRTGDTSRRASSMTRWVLEHPRWVLGITGILLAVSAVGVVRRSGDWIEYDLSKLRRRDSWEHGERYFGKRMDAALGRYLTPTVVLAETPEEARLIEDRVRALAARGEAGGLIGTVRSARTFLRPDVERSIEEARALEKVLTPRMKAELEPQDRELVETALSPAAFEPLTAEQIPSSLVLGLEERSGRIDRNVLVIPRLSEGGTWDAERLGAYARDLRNAATIDGATRPVAGPLLLSSDLARAMMLDGPRAALLSLAAVMGICVLAFRGRRRREGLGRYLPDRGSFLLSLLAIGSLLAGVLLMLGAMAWSGQRLNFSNFIALPITFGIAADYSINMLRRYQSERGEHLASGLSGTGGAVALCSATTIIGFGSLIMAQNQALFSFGLLAIIGELTCLGTAVISLPALLALHAQRAQSAPAAEALEAG